MKNILRALIIGAATAAAASSALAQDVAAGKSSFNKCPACHAIGEGAKNKVGPELNGLDGRKSGTVEAILLGRQQGFRHHLERGAVQGIHQGSQGQDPRNQDGVRRHQEGN